MYIQIENSYSDILASDSALARGEKNDCVVRSIASATNTAYNHAHQFCKDKFKRVDRRGVKTSEMNVIFDKGDPIKIGEKEFEVTPLSKFHTKNKYKLHGEIIWRMKTLKSFVQSHQTGTYIVLVAKHALTLKDGEIIDWKGMTFLPTRKVIHAYKLHNTAEGVQLEMLFE